MVRGLVLGALAFGAVFAAERQFSSMGNDIKRYDGLRAMSGDKAFWREILDTATGLIAGFSATGRGEAVSLFDSITSDIVRYATLRRM